MGNDLGKSALGLATTLLKNQSKNSSKQLMCKLVGNNSVNPKCICTALHLSCAACSQSSILEYYPSLNWISHFLRTLRHSRWPSYTAHLNATKPLRKQWSSSLLLMSPCILLWPIFFLKFKLFSKLVLNWCAIVKYICKLTKRVSHQLNHIDEVL